MKTPDQLRNLVGRTRDWLTGDDVSGRVLCVILDQQLYSLQKPHYRQQGRVCKAGTVITVDVSSEERTFGLSFTTPKVLLDSSELLFIFLSLANTRLLLNTS